MKEYKFTQEELSCLEQLPTPLAVYQFLDKRVVTRVLSEGFCRLFDFPNHADAYAVMTRDMYSTAHPDDASRVANEAYRFATQGGRYEVVYRVKTRIGGAYKIVHAMGEHVYRPGGERLAFVWYTDEGDYTGEDDQRKTTLRETFRAALHEESMIQASYYDYLTGLPNMSYFFELVEAGRKKAVEQGHTPAVLFFNLNGMKFYNQRYGFAEGDRLLRQVSKLLVDQFSAENCSRFGQDHFAVFTVGEGLEEKLRGLLRRFHRLDPNRSSSLRAGIYLERGEPVEASTACDRAKYACDSMRNSFVSGFAFFDESMLTQVRNRQYIIDHLDRALREGWIRVYYQPIVRTASGRVCDEEALARWIDPARGLLSPADFIATLEEARLIYKLDLYVVEQVLSKIQAQSAAGLHVVPVSVNLSRVDFDMCDMVEEIRRRVDAAGVDRDKLTIEITESVIGSDFAFMKQQVQRFQDLGFQVWMDDFGSGYSSLDLLQDIHFDLLKFDMRFMKRFGECEESKVILTELIRMAIGLGIDTVCEGVETAEQVSFLREVGCTKLQGYYFCKPIPPEEIVERNRRGIQIGFENPAESAYFAALGRINLYDMAVLAEGEPEALRNYFNTIPMAIMESTAEDFIIVRCNNSYRAFMNQVFGMIVIGVRTSYAEIDRSPGTGFLKALRQCGSEGSRLIIDERVPDGSTIHALMKRVAVNPVTGTSAIALAVLGVIAPTGGNAEVSYEQVASALAADYFELFYVDARTETFTQFTSGYRQRGMTIQRHGTDFFSACHRDASVRLYGQDREDFIRAFTKENILRTLEDHDAFTLTYHLLVDGEPESVNLKAVWMSPQRRHIIIGISSVNDQMQERQTPKA